MITKTGQRLVHGGMEKDALLVPGAFAYFRTSDLSDKEEKALKKHYGLSDDASLGLRSFGRGILGSMIGGMPGNLVSSVGRATFNPALMGAGTLAGLAGSVLGAHLATKKYTKEKAKEILGSK